MRYFTNLEFYPDVTHLGPGIQARRRLWTIGVYLMLCLGVFCRQVVDLKTVQLQPANLSLSVVVASLIVGLGVFPPAVRYLNIKTRVPGWKHVFSAFSIGFFMDLTMKFVVAPFFQLR